MDNTHVQTIKLSGEKRRRTYDMCKPYQDVLTNRVIEIFRGEKETNS